MPYLLNEASDRKTNVDIIVSLIEFYLMQKGEAIRAKKFFAAQKNLIFRLISYSTPRGLLRGIL